MSDATRILNAEKRGNSAAKEELLSLFIAVVGLIPYNQEQYILRC
jgi:hypothetical protein